MANGHKTGGRQKGTPNKVSADLKEFYFSFLDSNKEKLQACFDRLVESHPERD